MNEHHFHSFVRDIDSITWKANHINTFVGRICRCINVHISNKCITLSELIVIKFLVQLAMQTRSRLRHVMGCFRLTPMHNSFGQMHNRHHRLHPLRACVRYNVPVRIGEDCCITKLMKLPQNVCVFHYSVLLLCFSIGKHLMRKAWIPISPLLWVSYLEKFCSHFDFGLYSDYQIFFLIGNNQTRKDSISK